MALAARSPVLRPAPGLGLPASADPECQPGRPKSPRHFIFAVSSLGLISFRRPWEDPRPEAGVPAPLMGLRAAR